MAVPPLTQEDIDSDLRRLRLTRGGMAGLWRAVDDEGRLGSTVLSLLQDDAVFAAAVLKIAVECAGERGRSIGGIADAVSTLGMPDLSRAGLLFSLQRAFKGPERAYEWSEADHWSHALFSACAAEQIANALGHPSGRAFVAGLTHGLGRYFLSWHCGRWGVRLENPGPLSAAQLREEATRFGVNQCDAASLALGRLGFGDAVVVPVRWFCYPQFAGEFAEDAERLQAAVDLALLVRQTASGSRAPFDRLSAPQRQMLELTKVRVRRFSSLLVPSRSAVSAPPFPVGPR